MKLTLFLLLPTLALAVDLEKTLTFEHSKTQDQANQLATALAAVGQMKATATETALTVSGTQPQVDFATWAVTTVDRLSGHIASTDFPLDGEKVRLLVTAHAPNPRDLSEMATALRSLTEIRYLYMYAPSGAIFVKAQPAALDAAEFIWNQLDRAQPLTGIQTLAQPDGETYLTAAVTRPQDIRDFQEMATSIRSVAELRRLFTYNRTHTILARVPDAQRELFTWLVGELDKAHAPGATLRHPPLASDDGVTVTYLPASLSTAEFQQEVTRIRTAVQIRRAYGFALDHAIILRGSAQQLAEAQKMVAELRP